MKKMEVTPTLVGQNVTLRRPRESDKEDRRKCVRNLEEYRMYGINFENPDELLMENSDAWYDIYSGQPFHWVVSYREATLLALKLAFEVAKLSRIELTVLDFNARAIACYSKCGFSKEGLIENSVFVDGKRHHEIIMSISEKSYRGIAGLAKSEIKGRHN